MQFVVLRMVARFQCWRALLWHEATEAVQLLQPALQRKARFEELLAQLETERPRAREVIGLDVRASVQGLEGDSLEFTAAMDPSSPGDSPFGQRLRWTLLGRIEEGECGRRVGVGMLAAVSVLQACYGLQWPLQGAEYGIGD